MKSINIGYIPVIDHLRFYAAMMIVFFHLLLGETVKNLHLDIGVPLFFTLSGFLFFLIAHQSEKKIVYWKFIYNRFLRIYPMIIFLFFLMIVLIKNFTAISYINLLGLNLPGVDKVSWAISDWGYQYLDFNWWTVGVEFIFYLVFPFLYDFYEKYGILFLFRLLLLIIIFRYGVSLSRMEDYGFNYLAIKFNYSVFGNFDIFIVGMIAAHYICKFKFSIFFHKIFASKILCLIYILLMWTFLYNYINKFDMIFAPAIEAFLCALLIIFYTASFSNCENSRLSKVISYLGTLSFSIYLLHSFVKGALQHAYVEQYIISHLHINTNTASLITTIIFYIPAIFALSALTYHTIEKPFLNMRVKYY